MSSEEESDEESVTTPQQNQRKTTTTTTTAAKPATPTRRAPEPVKKNTRSASSDSSASTESSSSTPVHTGAPFTTQEVKQKYLSRGSIDHTADVPARNRVTSTGSNSGKVTQNTTTKPFQSRFLSNKTSAPAHPVNKDDEETETSSEEETDSEEESDDNTTNKVDNKEIAKSDIGPLLARSALARDNSTESARRTTKDEPYYGRSRYLPPKEETPVSKYTRTRPTAQEEEPRYGYTSRFLNKSKSSALVQPDEEEHSKYGSSTHNDDSDSKYPTSRSRYMALKERRQRLARSKSSHQFGDDDDVDEPLSPTSTNPSAYLASRGYGSTTSANDIARSRSTHALRSRESSPDRSATEKDGAALSSWARYLKNKYGNRSTAKDKDTTTSTSSPSSSSAAARRLSLGLPLRSSTELGSSDDDQKNMQGSPTTPTAAMAAAGE